MSEEKKVVNAVVKQEKLEDIIAYLRSIPVTDPISAICAPIVHALADRIEAAAKRERELLMSCARWILTHDIYGHMAQELLAECKNVLGDDGKFLMPKGDMA